MSVGAPFNEDPVASMARTLAEEVVDHRDLESMLVSALHRVSEGMGHPFKGSADKTALDLAELAYVRLQQRARMLTALNTVKDYLLDLESGCADDDPLKKLRLKAHAPLHEAIDAALAEKAGA